VDERAELDRAVDAAPADHDVGAGGKRPRVLSAAAQPRGLTPPALAITLLPRRIISCSTCFIAPLPYSTPTNNRRRSGTASLSKMK